MSEPPLTREQLIAIIDKKILHYNTMISEQLVLRNQEEADKLITERSELYKQRIALEKQ